MKIFISYSFRPENAWVEQYVIPMVRCFGHEPVTGRILDGGPLDDEVKKKIRQCRRVLCFVTRAKSRYDAAGQIVSYEAPDWVRDELAMARGADQRGIEFRERQVEYGGAAAFHAYVEFDRSELPKLLLDLAERIREWPVGPLQLRLNVPNALLPDVEHAVQAGTLKACCIVSENGVELSRDELKVHFLDEILIVPFWIKPGPDIAIDVEVTLGAKQLVCRGISPSVRQARLSVI